MSRGIARVWVCMGLLLGPGVGGAEERPRLDVTLSPVGAFASWAPGTRTSGYTAGLAWRFRRPLAHLTAGGHASTSRLFSVTTPVSVHLTPLPGRALRPFVGAGASLLVVHGNGPEAPSTLRVGAELSSGLDVTLGEQLFLVAEGRLQGFALRATPLGTGRLLLGSAHLGMGVRL